MISEASAIRKLIIAPDSARRLNRRTRNSSLSLKSALISPVKKVFMPNLHPCSFSQSCPETLIKKVTRGRYSARKLPVIILTEHGPVGNREPAILQKNAGLARILNYSQYRLGYWEGTK